MAPPATLSRFVDRSTSAVRSLGANSQRVIPTALAWTLFFAGCEKDERREVAKNLATAARVGEDHLELVWHSLEFHRPWLAAVRSTALSIGVRDKSLEAQALAAVFDVLVDMDVVDLFRDKAGAGDTLGYVYSLVRAPGDRKAGGAFYTPASVATLMAKVVGVDTEGPIRLHDPCCGSGSLLLAHVREAKAAGRLEDVHVVAGDIDPFALFLCAAQLWSTGVRHARLVQGNSLTEPLLA